MVHSKSPAETTSKGVPLIWETEVVKLPDGRVEMKPKRPLNDLSTAQAARFLGVSKWTVSDLYRAGLLKGFKPGAIVARKDGKASNAVLRLDAASVLEYKAAREAVSPFKS